MEEKKASFQQQKTIEQKKSDKKIIKVVNLKSFICDPVLLLVSFS